MGLEIFISLAVGVQIQLDPLPPLHAARRWCNPDCDRVWPNRPKCRKLIKPKKWGPNPIFVWVEFYWDIWVIWSTSCRICVLYFDSACDIFRVIVDQRFSTTYFIEWYLREQFDSNTSNYVLWARRSTYLTTITKAIFIYWIVCATRSFSCSHISTSIREKNPKSSIPTTPMRNISLFF